MLDLEWKPIVVGVDRSPESAGAVVLAWEIAGAAGTQCHLVHGTREAAAVPAWPLPPTDPEQLTRRITAAAVRELTAFLSGKVAAEALERLEVLIGSGARAVAGAVAKHDAGLVVLGGKRHAPPTRWLGRSTAHHVLHTVDVPLLIAWAPRKTIRRILVAVDLSGAAAPTLSLAHRFARLVGARLRVLHVVEDLPYVDDLLVGFDLERHYTASVERFERQVHDELGAAQPTRVVRGGTPARAIARESAAWDADLLVVGSHGRGWVDRLLIGSTTERLINHPPTSLLIAPARIRTGAGGLMVWSVEAATPRG
jgi:nucleotide-binding universal stress UspA family protein